MQSKIAFLLFFLLGWQFSNAQKWCPVGATWYFEEGYPTYASDTSYPVIAFGYDKAQYSKDTIVAGQICKVITDTSYYENYGHIQVNASAFTYSSGDTVYILTRGVFLPYFYFACHTGDTLLVPWGNTLVATYVDSTGVQFINGDSLRFYNYRAIDSGYACIGVVGGISSGQVVERLGNTNVGPGNNSFSFDFSCLEYEAGYFLHCYQDSSFALYSADTTNSCNYTLTGIANLDIANSISMYPNPASHYSTLLISDINHSYTAVIYNITGQPVMPLFANQHMSAFNFNIGLLADGVYFLRVSDESGRVATKKLVKAQ